MPHYYSKSVVGPRRRRSIRETFTYVEARQGDIEADPFKSSSDKDTIVAALNSHFMFISLTDDDKEVVAESMMLYTFNPGDYIFEQGKAARNYFVVKSGLLEEFKDNKKINKIHPGEGFGELALIYDSLRTTSVRAAEKSRMWAIERNQLRKIIEEMHLKLYTQNREFLDKVPLLDPLSSQQKDTLATNLVNVKYTAGQKIITQGDTGDELFILKEGLVSIQRGTQEVAKLSAGTYFGEKALLNNEPRNASCVALEPYVKCLSLSSDTLKKVLGDNLQKIIDKNTIMESINRNSLLKKLSASQKLRVSDSLEIKQYKLGDIVIDKGTASQFKMFIVISGKLQSSKNAEKSWEFKTCIGHKAVCLQEERKKYDDHIIAVADSTIGEITKYQFEISINGNYRNVVKENSIIKILEKVNIFRHFDSESLRSLLRMIHIQKKTDGEIILQEKSLNDSLFIVKRGQVDIFQAGNQLRTAIKYDYFGERVLLLGEESKYTCIANGEVVLWVILKEDFLSHLDENTKSVLSQRIKYEENEYKLEDLKVLKEIGSGTYSKVFLVTSQTDEELFALKVLPRSVISERFAHEHVLLEKKILRSLNHPFIVQLVKTFKCEQNLYFLLEFVHGLEMTVMLNQIGLLPCSDARFYAASLILVLEYLHERDIIYRDLKTENILIDEAGYLKLIDFDTSKILHGRTYTVLGAPHYTAPEVIIGRGYTYLADFWSLGVCLFEFIYGFLPFADQETDVYKIYESILEDPLVFPEGADELAEKFIEVLVNKVPEFRICGSVDKLKMHEWLSNIKWNRIITKEWLPPYVPDVGTLAQLIEEHEPKQLTQVNVTVDQDVTVYIDTELEAFKASIPEDWDTDF